MKAKGAGEDDRRTDRSHFQEWDGAKNHCDGPAENKPMVIKEGERSG